MDISLKFQLDTGKKFAFSQSEINFYKFLEENQS